MKTLKLSDFLSRKEIKPFLLGAFLSRITETEFENKKYFFAYSSFRASKAVYRSDFDFYALSDKLISIFNKYSGFYNWEKYRVKDQSCELRFYIENDMNITATQFYSFVYKKFLSSEWTSEDGLTENKKSFIRGFMELRGSVDTSGKMIAQDYYYNNNIELKKCQIITSLLDLPMNYVNFNARNLQPQYVDGTVRRNAQFRINLMFYAKEIGFINEYKAAVFKNTYSYTDIYEKDGITYFSVYLPEIKNTDVTFIKYLNFFTNYIYEKQLTPAAIKELRKKLGFDSSHESTKSKRDKTIVEIFSEISEDKCAICGTKSTYTNPVTNRQHFEVHHVISLKNGKELDNIANLVKLCPTCHDMLRKNATEKTKQIRAIIKILSEHPEVSEFAKSYLQTYDINELAEEIQERLG